MTLFEEICKKVGAGNGSAAEEAMMEIVNDLLFNTTLSDEDIATEAVEVFNRKYK